MTADDFPAGTKFFVKGADVPVAVLPDGTASSWYGGTPMNWDSAHLRFAMGKFTEGFIEVPVAEFARLVAESESATEKRQKLFRATTDAILEKAREDFAANQTDEGDYLFARPGASFPSDNAD